MMSKIKSAKKKLPEFDKYEYYIRSVQSPENDVLHLRDTYKELKKKTPRHLREDFCGTFANCCEWVKLHKDNHAYGVDLDPEPIYYGRKNYLSKLKASEAERVHIFEANVLSPDVPRADIIAALNFSYYIFKTRAALKSYFANCLRTLNEDGILLVDSFGGSQCQVANEEETVHKDFSYYWDQDLYDPVNNHGLFYIHFKRKGERKRQRVFTYDWRMWTILEIREVMEEVGFRKTHVYWEGTTKSGEGDGNFKRVNAGEECEAWIAYIVGEK